jgi:hypothetical protein
MNAIQGSVHSVSKQVWRLQIMYGDSLHTHLYLLTQVGAWLRGTGPIRGSGEAGKEAEWTVYQTVYHELRELWLVTASAILGQRKSPLI